MPGGTSYPQQKPEQIQAIWPHVPNFPDVNSWNTWAASILHGIGAPDTVYNRTLLAAWAMGENTNAQNNPLATTQPWVNSSDFNSVGVKNYASVQDGISATVTTLNNGNYPIIVNDLKKGNVAPQQIVNDASSNGKNEFGTWGTGASLVNSQLQRLQVSGVKIQTNNGDILSITGGAVSGAANVAINAVTAPVTKELSQIGFYILYSLAVFGGGLLLIAGFLLIGADLGIELLVKTRTAKTGQKVISSVGGYRRQKAATKIRAEKAATTKARADELHARRIKRDDQREKIQKARIRQERAKARREEMTIPRSSPKKEARARKLANSSQNKDGIPY